MLWADVGDLTQCTLDFVTDQSAALIPHIFQEHFLFQLFPGKVFKLIISNQGGTIQSDEREKVHTILASSKNCHFLLVTKSLLSLSIFQMSNAETHLFWQQDSRKTWNYWSFYELGYMHRKGLWRIFSRCQDYNDLCTSSIIQYSRSSLNARTHISSITCSFPVLRQRCTLPSL